MMMCPEPVPVSTRSASAMRGGQIGEGGDPTADAARRGSAARSNGAVGDGHLGRPRPMRARRPCPRPCRRRRPRARGARSSSPRCSVAISTAAWDTDAVARPIAVSVRARLPTSTAWRNSRFSAAREPPSACASSHADAHLAEDLVLAEHRRVEPGGDLEQVGAPPPRRAGCRGADAARRAPDRRARRRSRGCRRRRRGSARRRRTPRCGCTWTARRPRAMLVRLCSVVQRLRHGVADRRRRARAGRAAPVRWLTPMTTMDTARSVQALRRSRSGATRRPGTTLQRGRARAALLVVAQDLELDREVDLAHPTPRGTESTVGAKFRIDVMPACTRRSAASWAACAGRGDHADGAACATARSAAGRRGGGPRPRR